MLFGLPWFAIVAIVAIGGGMFFAYKEKELQVEEKIQVKAREVHELEKLVHNLKSRVDSLEKRVNEPKPAAGKADRGTSEIEIDDPVSSTDGNNSSSGTKVKNN